ncbi:DNA-binding CsgD family transcriptional regulator/energy-coupling factor transporter ATP-binding protein EcfA2 [Actinoplanes tereljensis]|uniref:Transcriptional regulator n=1 Tax=Paractinoplanes tereljensis TaxID=571912 RepID=A0A919NRH3_9ACTN|nr:LuxR family transcriptional regulator [Actinoplanes tereljensis]GIF23806.1 transcriptional regulator [Actinoplanes tereljensis]
MTTPAGAVLEQAADLVGRDDDLARLADWLRPAPGHRALLLTGDRGAGKSRLLAAGLQLAREQGDHRVLVVHTTGDDLLRQLLLAVRHELPGLPGGLGRAAFAFLGLSDDPVPAEPVLRRALSAALTGYGLLVADDVQQLTPGGAELLAELAAVVPAVLLAGRAGRIPAALTGLPVHEVRPLGPDDAVRLLDAQDGPVTGRDWVEILRRAAGNPAAIVELSAGTPRPGGLWSAYASEIGLLPAACRRLLLHLAAATPPADAELVRSAAGVPGSAWTAAERAGIVVRDGDRVRFTHPLAAEAAYREAPAHARRAAHRDLAVAFADAPEWRALHLAAAATDRGEAIAADLEAAAGTFRGRHALFEATSAMEQAAGRTPQPETAARRYAQAATDARNLGATDWAVDLYTTVRRLTADPDLIIRAAHTAATALSRSGRQTEAYNLVSAARRAGATTDRPIALTVAGLAAAVAAISGHEEHRLGLAPMLAAAEPAPDAANAIFVRLIMDPGSHPGRALCDAVVVPRPGIPIDPPVRHHLNIIGTIAGYEDRSRLAVDLLRAALREERAPRSSLSGIETIPVLISALVDTGEWGLAERYATEVGPLGLPVYDANLDALRAQLHALRGDGEKALELARRTWRRLDMQQHRSTHVRLLRAAALAAAAGGDYDNAYRHLRSMFDRDGRALQTYLAGRSVAELAAAAARNGRRDEVRGILDRVRLDAGAEPSARMRLLLHLGEALLLDGDRAEHHFRLATVDPAGQEWPYERAMARLHYGEWLRRARRPRDARSVLAPAAADFRRLGAVHAAGLADRELRASGRHDGPVGSARLAVLTAQERQVAMLAARGLRNREIAEQLFISARTVGAHLHSVYAKLAIRGRHQLRDVDAGSAPNAR